MQTFAKSQRQETSNERGGSVKPAAAKEQSRLFGIIGLQQSIGNAAVGRLLRQVAAEAAAKKASETQRQEDSEVSGPEVNSNGPTESPVDSATQTEPAVQAGTKPVPGESPSQSDNASVDNQAGMPGPAAQAPILTAVGTQASDNKFVSFTQSSASSIARTISTFGTEVRQEFEAVRTSSAEQAPVIKVTLPGDPESAATEKSQPKKPAALPTADGITAPTVSTGDGLTAEETVVPSQPDGEGVSTSAGAAPKMRLEGDADPTHLSTATSQSQAIGTEIRNQIATDIVDVANAATIRRTGVDREEEIFITATKASPAIQASQEMLEFINTDVPANVRAIADADFAPLLEQSLAGPRQQVEQATQQRDADRDQAFADAMAETEAASQQAHEDQQKAVKDGYDQIAAEKQKGLEEGQQTLTEFDTEVKQRHVANDELIRTKVQTEQEKADEAIRNGEAEARAAEEQAHKDKKKAEEEAERNKPEEPDRKWYEKVADWFVDAINRWKDALVAAVTAVFDYARKVISDALTAAKNLAVGIIRSVKSFVVSTIQTFAAGLKDLVNGLLVAFPALRDKVNAAIDGVVAVTVQIVETVASKLEETVTAIVDKVQSTVNRILDICELVIVTQIQIVGALLNGNFLDAAKILFLAACKAVGISGEEFLDILADANDALLDIMKRPAAFLGNLLKAVGQGMSNFFSNFPQRMIGGLTGWLFGQVAEGGIVLPKSFDLKSIFTLLLQVMGFTYDYIKTKVVSLVGEKAVSVIEQVMTPIRILFTEGPGALWHWLADQAEQAKATIVQAVSEWIVTKIITEAAIKLATMFTPVGAFVQAVLMMYNTIMFFVEKIKEIFAWVKSITSSLKTIAVGAIATAADYIDQSMAKSIPLIIAFLAKLLGIDGISSKIRDIVSNLRTPVDKAITFVVENLIKIAKAAWGGVKAGAQAVKEAVTGWWTARKEFTTSAGESHALYFSGEGDKAQLTIASTPEQFTRYLKRLEGLGTVSQNDIADLRWRYAELEQIIAQPPPKSEQEETQRRNGVLYKLTALSEVIQRMPRVDEQLTDEEMFARFSSGLGLESQECRVFVAEEGITPEDIASFAADMTPVVSTAKSAIELFTGIDPITEKDASRWWAAVGLIPFGKVGKPAATAVKKVVGGAAKWVPNTAKSVAKAIGKTSQAVVHRYSSDEIQVLIRFWEDEAKSASSLSKKEKYLSYKMNLEVLEKDASSLTKIPHEQSEREVRYLYSTIGGDKKERVFLNGQPKGNRRGIKGSTIPDSSLGELMIEVKSYELIRGGKVDQGAISKMLEGGSGARVTPGLKKQVADRKQVYSGLQTIVIDIRGQNASVEQVEEIATSIASQLSFPIENIQVLH